MTPRVDLHFAPWTELRAAAPPEPPWVLEGYIARGAVTLLAGKPKAGKSTAACAIAEAVDGGTDSFLGVGVTGGPVVYVSEEGPGTLAPKLPESSRSTALTREGAWPKPSWAKLIEAAVAEAERIGAVLLVIDALAFWAAFGEGQEKDAGTAQATMDALGAATGAGLAVLLVHHQRKAGGEDGDAVRGSGAIFGAVDVLVELERVGEDAPSNRRLVAVGRWASTPPVLVIDRDANTGAWRVIGQAESRGDAANLGEGDRIVAALPNEAPGVTEPELLELLDSHPRKVAVPLRKLHERGLVIRAGEGRKGDPYRYWNSPPQSSSNAGGASGSSFSSTSIRGGEREPASEVLLPSVEENPPRAPSANGIGGGCVSHRSGPIPGCRYCAEAGARG